MKLRFLGQTYSTNNSSMETVATSHKARFLGQSYTVRRPAKSLQPKLQVSLKKYRGISYGDI